MNSLTCSRAISSLTDLGIWKEFTPADGDEERAAREHWAVMVAANYPVIATLYGLLALLVIVRFMSRKLTFADLALDARIELQYYLASRAYGVVKDDELLAAAQPTITYNPGATN